MSAPELFPTLCFKAGAIYFLMKAKDPTFLFKFLLKNQRKVAIMHQQILILVAASPHSPF